MRSLPAEDRAPNGSLVIHLPHQVIWKVADQENKIRVVINASCRVNSGPVLNDCLHAGPALENDLTNVFCIESS